MQRPATRETSLTSASGPTKAGGRGGGRGGPDMPRGVQRRPHPTLSPQRTPPAVHKGCAAAAAAAAAGMSGGGAADLRQSSSSSCDMTGNRPENSSGEEGRGIGGRDHVRSPASAQPPLPTGVDAEDTFGGEDGGVIHHRSSGTDAGSAPHAPVFAGRPVYYDTLPQPTLPNDPLLKDVLAALEESSYCGSGGRHDHGGPAHLVAAAEEEAEEDDEEAPRMARRAAPGAEQQGISPKARGGRGGGGGPRRGQRRGPPPSSARQPPQQHQHPQASSTPATQHSRTFSEENILAGLEEEDEEDRMNLHNRATVDIVLPVPLDSLMKTLEYTQHSKRLRRKRFPIVINVTGAVWIIGSHLWSTMMARVLAQRGYVVFCPDYRNFPQTTMEGMTLDVSDAVAWVLNNAERYNGDLSNVTLIGQSAGAHLTMMSLLSQAQLSAYRSNTMYGTYENVPPPSDVAYNVPRYNPRESIHRYVGLSGMYNIEGLVEHFQREGLNTPVLHQIAGGRDQLPRYSIHAYFDDRRGGDTGEVLPDNIFDYFPQHMYFVHGDADKCAPVTESASLVAMLRTAQERYALRRRERNEEARRHALRSRRLLPGALAPATTTTVGGGGAGKSVMSAAPPHHRRDGFLGEDESYGAAPRRHPTPAWGQWGAGEEDGNDYGEEDFVVDGESAMQGAASMAYDGSGGGHPAAGPSIFVGDSSARRGGYGTPAATSPAPQQEQQQQQSMTYGPTAVVSPIVPHSRHDIPRSPVELEFIVIPNGRHSDAFVDECIAAGRSCCVDLLCDYESAVDFPSRSFSGSTGHGLESDSLCGSMAAASSTGQRGGGEHVPAWLAQSSQVCAMPDGILPLAVPTEERSLPLRLCTLICPF